MSFKKASRAFRLLRDPFLILTPFSESVGIYMLVESTRCERDDTRI